MVKPKKGPYAVLRAKSTPAEPVPNPAPVPGLEQPSVAMDPFLAPRPQAAAGLTESPGRGPGAQDLLTNKFSDELARGKTLNVYQDPLEYNTHLNTVMGTKPMQDFAAALERHKQFREDFLKTVPNQADLSPVMALADYIAKGKGTAQRGYTKPASYEDLVGQINGLLGAEQRGRTAFVQAGFEQAGGLKSGSEEAQTKTGAQSGRTQGYKQPSPRSQNPSTLVDSFYRGFQNTPIVKESINGISAAKAVQANISKKNWLGDEAARAEILKAMKLYPVSDRDAARVTGSPDFFSRAQRTIDRLANGRSLTSEDQRTIQQFAEYAEKRAFTELNEAKHKYIEGVGPSHGLDYNSAARILDAQIPSPTAEPEKKPQGASSFERLFEQMIKEDKK